MPEFGPDFDQHRFVMEVGRSAQAICHSKGCYLGQESVVMARDRGQINRALVGVKASGGELSDRGHGFETLVIRRIVNDLADICRRKGQTVNDVEGKI